MTGKVKAAATVDEAMDAHNAFLDKSIHTLLMYQVTAVARCSVPMHRSGRAYCASLWE